MRASRKAYDSNSFFQSYIIIFCSLPESFYLPSVLSLSTLECGQDKGYLTYRIPLKSLPAKVPKRWENGERGKSVTVICATNAAETYIPPMFIYPRKRTVNTPMKNAPAGAIGHCTEIRWTDEKSFLKWLMHFSSVAKPSSQEKHLIISDGRDCHKTLAAVKYAREHDNELLTFLL